MEHTVKKSSVYPYTNTNAGSNGDINNTVQSLSAAICYFAQAGTIYICINPHRNIQFFFQTKEILISPCQLWCFKDITVIICFRIYSHRSESSNSQRFNSLIFEVCCDLWDSLLRRSSRNGNLFNDRSVFSSQCADHFSAACF